MSLRRNLWQAFWELIPKPIRNRYILVLLVFFVWMFFFDGANVITQWKLNQSVEKLKRDKEYYQEHLKQAEEDRKDLEEHKEKYAREKYYMKKGGEEVFIFMDEE
jgi:cell division protein FtsB